MEEEEYGEEMMQDEGQAVYGIKTLEWEEGESSEETAESEEYEVMIGRDSPGE